MTPVRGRRTRRSRKRSCWRRSSARPCAGRWRPCPAVTVRSSTCDSPAGCACGRWPRTTGSPLPGWPAPNRTEAPGRWGLVWSPAALHFLFNTLTAIQAYVRSRPGLAEEMIGALAQLVRATLSRGEGPVLVAEELALVQMYLGLERARLGHRLRTVLDVDPGTLGVRIPALVMQPLVENAVVHAAACRVDGATLRLAVRYRHERKQLLIMVADDGPGVPRPQVAMEGAGLHLGL